MWGIRPITQSLKQLPLRRDVLRLSTNRIQQIMYRFCKKGIINQVRRKRTVEDTQCYPINPGALERKRVSAKLGNIRVDIHPIH